MDSLRHPILFIRALLFYIGFLVSIITISTIAITVGRFWSFENRYRFISLWPRFTLWWLTVSCSISYDIKGLDNIRQLTDQKTNAIILSKHQCTWETCFIQTIVSPTSTAVKKELLRTPFFGWAIALLKPLIIDRDQKTNTLKQLLVQGKDRLKEGTWVLLFPEGTRVLPGEQVPFTVGGAMLATQSGYPVFPIAHNAGEYWPAKSFIKYPGTIKVVIGEKIESKNLKPKQLNQAVQDWINTTMCEISQMEKEAADKQSRRQP